jgi:hypothetical protein
MFDTVGVRKPQGSGSPSGGRHVMRNAASGMRQGGLSVLTVTSRALVRSVWAAVAIVNTVLLLDFVFRLIGAKDEGFAHAVLSFGSTVASPFDGIFASVGSLAGYALKWSDLVVVFLCTLAGFVVTRMLSLAQARRPRVA